MALLENHLEQISLSAAAIAELPFPPPKKYTNALLRPHDITALIRDTEEHERVLFRSAPTGRASSQGHDSGPRRNTAYGSKRESDPMPGARERISSLRSRFDQLTASVTKYEARVSKQTAQLAKRNRRGDTSNDPDAAGLGESADLEMLDERTNDVPITAEDLDREEQEIRELEKKKRALEDRVSGMERDLGGLLR
ncbi:MAG: hypothetical protein Q9178_001038 [Gyalolechia marmorata]